MKKLRILLADDHKIIRDGLKLLVNDQPDMHVVGEAGNGREVLEKARELKPNVVVMDLSMPELNGLQATTRLKEERPEIKVVALTVHEDESYLRQLCQAGAAGYVLKRSAGDELIQAIRTVAKGGLFFDATLANKALAGQRAPATAVGEPRAAELSEREKDVLIQLAWGFSNKEIAASLSLVEGTVKVHLTNILSKLRVSDRTQAVLAAMKQGIVEIE